jgi:hypothetical protein
MCVCVFFFKPCYYCDAVLPLRSTKGHQLCDWEPSSQKRNFFPLLLVFSLKFLPYEKILLAEKQVTLRHIYTLLTFVLSGYFYKSASSLR